MLRKIPDHKHGFTLVEIIVAMAIIALVSVLMMPVISQAYQQIFIAGDMLKNEKQAAAGIENLVSIDDTALVADVDETFVLPGNIAVGAERVPVNDDTHGQISRSIDTFVIGPISEPNGVDAPNDVVDIFPDSVYVSGSNIVVRMMNVTTNVEFAIDAVEKVYDASLVNYSTGILTLPGYNSSVIYSFHARDKNDTNNAISFRIPVPPSAAVASTSGSFYIITIGTTVASNIRYLYMAQGQAPENNDRGAEPIYTMDSTNTTVVSCSIPYQESSMYDLWIRYAGIDRYAPSIFVKVSGT